MIITLVVDQFYKNNHGTSISAQRFYNGLIKEGHIVKVLAIDQSSNTLYALKEKYYGKLINKIINSQGFQFAKADTDTIKQAIKGSDLVHVYLPFKLGYTTIKLCRELNIPCTAGFHLLPENITSTIYMNKIGFVNNFLWTSFYKKTYAYIKHIHCPSLMVANELVKHNYNSCLHVISNGFDQDFKHMDNAVKPEKYSGKFVIVFIGRFSREKRYDLIIKAVKQSKYKHKIQLIFGGNGPVKKQIMKMSKSLPNYPEFSFFSKEELCNLFSFADLYIHPADIEVEGMSCLEAIACGCVPIVSDSIKSATRQFALSQKHSVFKHGDSKDLASKIDWWIEHPQKLEQHRRLIAEHAQNFTIDKSMKFYIDMFEKAVKDWDNTYDGRDQAKAPTIINYYNS